MIRSATISILLLLLAVNSSASAPVTIFYGLNESHGKSWAQCTDNGLVGISYFKRSAKNSFSGNLIYKSIQPSGAELEEIVTTGSSLENSVLLFDSLNKPHIFSAQSDDSDQIVVHYFKNESQSWNSEVIVHFNNEGGKFIYEMSAEKGLNDTSHLLVLKTRSNPDSNDYYNAYINAHLYHLTNAGGSWQKELIANYDTVWTLDEYSKALNRQDFKIDSNGKIHVIFNKQINASSQLKYATNKNGSWEIETAVNYAAGTRDDGGWFPSLALDNQDQPYISCVYVGRVSSGSAMYARLLLVSKEISIWIQEEIASGDDGYYGSDGRDYTGVLSHLVFDQNNRPHLIFSDIASSHAGMNYWNLGNIRYAVKNETGWNISTIYHQPLPNGFFNATEMYNTCLLIPENSGKIVIVGQELNVLSSTEYSFNLLKKEIGINNIPVNTFKKNDLLQNYPNPFNPQTTIYYNIKDGFRGLIKLKIYNTKGEVVQTFTDKATESGHFSQIFNGSKLSSGIYYYEIEAGDFKQMKKMVMIK